MEAKQRIDYEASVTIASFKKSSASLERSKQFARAAAPIFLKFSYDKFAL